MQVENCPLSKRSSLAALCSNPATRVADQVAILFASGAHAGFDQLAEAAARLRTQFPSLQHVVGTAVRTSLLQWLMVRPAYALLTEGGGTTANAVPIAAAHQRRYGARMEALLPADGVLRSIWVCTHRCASQPSHA